MRCVKLTLPPRLRRRWLLMTMRWSISSLTGSERTLVAVGMDSDASMFLAVRADAPRSVVRVGCSVPTSGRSDGFGGSPGAPPRAPGGVGRLSFGWVVVSTVGWRRAAGAALCAGAGAFVGALAGVEVEAPFVRPEPFAEPERLEAAEPFEGGRGWSGVSWLVVRGRSEEGS